jgi:putative DNA primase/helicase
LSVTTPTPSNEPESTSESEGKPKSNAAFRLGYIVHTRATELVWDGENAYAVIQYPDHVRCFVVQSAAFRRWLITAYLRDGHKSVPSGEQQKQALSLIEAQAEQRGVSPTPAIRVAGDDGTVYIDLGDDAWRCIKVTSGGWEIAPLPVEGPYLYRPPKMGALPEPDRANIDAVNRLRGFVSLADERDWRLFLVWLLQALRPQGPYPVLLLHGAAGSTKSSAEKIARSLTDPIRKGPEELGPTAPGAGPPREIRDVSAKARQQRVVAFDNVSYIDQWLSDVFCRLATGGEISDRTLFTNFDESSFTASRPVMISSVVDPITQADLADRAIKIQLAEPKERKTEEALWEEYDEARPEILGALMEILARALVKLPEAMVPEGLDVRMADFARFGEAVGMVAGWQPGEFTRAYHENRTEAAAEMGEQDLIYEPLRKLLVLHSGEWSGTLESLRTELNDRVEDGTRRQLEWPRSAKALSNYLVRRKSSLAAAGITFDSRRSHGQTIYTVRHVERDT